MYYLGLLIRSPFLRALLASLETGRVDHRAAIFQKAFRLVLVILVWANLAAFGSRLAG